MKVAFKVIDPHLNQCFSIAFVESIMVPSMSNKKPWKEACVGGAEKDMAICDAQEKAL